MKMAKQSTRKNANEERREKLRNRTNRTAKGRTGSNFGILSVEGFDDVSFIKAEKGWNLWDIIPFVISEDWYPKLRGPNGVPGGLGKDDIDYKLEVPIHTRVGIEEISVFCLLKAFGEPCFNCDQVKEEPDKKAKKALYPRWRAIYNIINTKKDDGVEIFDVSEFLFERELLKQAENSDGEVITFSDLEEGNTVEFKAGDKKVINEDTGKSYSFKEYGSFKFRDREAYDEDVLKQVYPLDSMLKILTYEQQQRLYLGISDDDEIENEGEKEEQETEKDEDIPISPDGGIETEEGDCPAGREFGADNSNENDDCLECPQETFDLCCDEKDRLEAEEKTKPKTRQRSPKKTNTPKKRVRGDK